MQDRKALQAGTSHFLGQNFARSSQIRFQSDQGVDELAWTTSWGVSTRLVGGLIMTHADDDGMVMPPAVASAHVVIMPIAKDPAVREGVMEYAQSLKRELEAQTFHGRNLVVEMDDRDAGGRAWDWIKKGVPVRVEVGPRDMAENAVFTGRRDTPGHKKESMPRADFVAKITDILGEIQDNLYRRALAFREEHSVKLDGRDEFYDFFTPENPETPGIHGGFALSGWCGDPACEAKIKEDLTVTIRLVPISGEKEACPCVLCGKPSEGRVVFAKSY